MVFDINFMVSISQHYFILIGDSPRNHECRTCCLGPKVVTMIKECGALVMEYPTKYNKRLGPINESLVRASSSFLFSCCWWAFRS